MKLLKRLAPDNRGRITTKSNRIIKSLIELDHGRDAAEWAILNMIELGWLTPFFSIWGGVINKNRKTEIPNHTNQSELSVERMLSQQDVTLVVEAVFWTETVVPEPQDQNEIVQPHRSDAERRSLAERFVSIAEKFLRDIDASKTTEFRVLGLPPALVDEMEDICSQLGISNQNQPLKIENRHAHEIRKRLSEENVTDTTDMVFDGRCYTASPYGDALQVVLWHWVCESGDGSIMRNDIEPDDKWNHFADILKRNLSEWIEYLRLKFTADRPTDDNKLERPASNAEHSTVDSEDDRRKLVDDSREAKVVGDSTSKNAILTEMQPAWRNAYLAGLYAETQSNRRLTDDEAYDWLTENGTDKVDKLDDYKLPSRDTFATYMNHARRIMGEQRKKPKTRISGRSIVNKSDT